MQIKWSEMKELHEINNTSKRKRICKWDEKTLETSLQNYILHVWHIYWSMLFCIIRLKLDLPIAKNSFSKREKPILIQTNHFITPYN